MKIIRYHNSPIYNPVTSHTGLRDEMDRLFEIAFPALQLGQACGSKAGEIAVDLYQEKDAFVIRAELPGFRKEELSVEVAEGLLTLAGHHKTETKPEEQGANPTVQERRVSRTVSLPEQVQVDKINAAYTNGILTVTLPKRETVKPRQIAVDIK